MTLNTTFKTLVTGTGYIPMLDNCNIGCVARTLNANISGLRCTKNLVVSSQSKRWVSEEKKEEKAPSIRYGRVAEAYVCGK